jgi:hypothetical protein
MLAGGIPAAIVRESFAQDLKNGSVMSKGVANFIHALVAVLAGNAVYFLLMRYLPLGARHEAFRIDLGMVVDFLICLAALGMVKAVAARKSDSERPKG